MPVSGEEAYYGNFENELRNFWTNSSYYCVLAGLGPSSIARSVEAFQNIKLEQEELLQRLPSNYEFLKRLHRRDGMDLAPTGTR